MVFDQVEMRNGVRSPSYYYDDKISVVVQESDKTITEFIKPLGKYIATHILPFQAKILKKGPGGKRKRVAGPLDMTDENTRKQLEKEKEVETRRVNANALSMARKGATLPPIRYISIDPFVYWIKDVRIICPDQMYVEQLYTDYESFGQITALRQMSNAKPGSNREESARLRIKAISDCLLLVKSSPIEITHHRFIRAEAAFSLAKWQNEHAPAYSVGDEDSFATSWRGLAAFISAMHTLYSHEIDSPDMNESTKVRFYFLSYVLSLHIYTHAIVLRTNVILIV